LISKYVNPLASIFFRYLRYIIIVSELLVLILAYILIIPQIIDVSLRSLASYILIAFMIVVIALNAHRRFYVLSLALTILGFNSVLAIHLSVLFGAVTAVPEVTTYIMFAIVIGLIVIPVVLASYSPEYELLFIQVLALLALVLLFSDLTSHIFVVLTITLCGIIVFSSNFSKVFTYYLKHIQLLIVYLFLILLLNYSLILTTPLKEPLIDIQPLRGIIKVEYFYPGFDVYTVIVLLTLGIVFMLLLRTYGSKIFVGNYILNAVSMAALNSVVIVVYYFIYLVTLRGLGLSYSLNDVNFVSFLVTIGLASIFTYLPYFAFSETSLLSSIRGKLLNEILYLKTKLDEYREIAELIMNEDDKVSETLSNYLRTIDMADTNLSKYFKSVKRLNILNYVSLSEEILMYLRNIKGQLNEFDKFIMRYLDNVITKLYYVIRALCEIANIDIDVETKLLKDIPEPSAIKVTYLDISNAFTVIKDKVNFIRRGIKEIPSIVSGVGIRYEMPELDNLKTVQVIEVTHANMVKLIEELKKAVSKYYDEFIKSCRVVEEYVGRVEDSLRTISYADTRKVREVLARISKIYVAHPSIRELLMNAKTLGDIHEYLVERVKEEGEYVIKYSSYYINLPKDITDYVKGLIKDCEDSLKSIRGSAMSTLSIAIAMPLAIKRVLTAYLEIIYIREAMKVAPLILPAAERLISEKGYIDLNDLPIIKDVGKYVLAILSNVISNARLSEGSEGGLRLEVVR